MIEHELNDVWRTKNPFEINYTFMKKKAHNTAKARLYFLLTSQKKTMGYIESIRIENQTSLSDHRIISFTIAKNKIENGSGYWRFKNDLVNQAEFTFGMSNRIIKTIKDNPMKKKPQEDTEKDPQQPQKTPQKLKPQHLMDMILLDAKAYTIKYTAMRKREENDKKQKKQDQINDTVRLLELEDGANKDYTDELTDRITTLKNNIQIKMDDDKIEKTREYMAKRNLEAKTPTKSYCNQVNKSKKKLNYNACFKTQINPQGTNCKPKPKAIH